MKKLILIFLVFMFPYQVNAWIINNEIQRRGYPEYVNTDYEYNRIREYISDLEMMIYIICISKGNNDRLLEMKDMGYMTDKKQIIDNIKILLKELKQYSYLIKK